MLGKLSANQNIYKGLRVLTSVGDTEINPAGAASDLELSHNMQKRKQINDGVVGNLVKRGRVLQELDLLLQSRRDRVLDLPDGFFLRH